MPSGRWPSNPQHPLALSQQLAVNLVLGTLADSDGILGINGPPGTGKTTLIRDLVSELVVRRADAIATLRSAQDGLLPPRWIKTSNGREHRFQPLAGKLTGFEVVVASSNNKAVENVSLELPKRDSLDTDWLVRDHYLGDLGTAVLNSDRLDTPGQWGDRQAWGLFAAALGNSRNRGRFVNAFWYGKDGKTPGEIERPAIRHLLKDSAETTSLPFSQAKKEFRRARQRVEDLRAERVTVATALTDTDRLRTHIDTVAARCVELRTTLAYGADAMVRQTIVVDQLAAEGAFFFERRRQNQQFRPGFWQSMFTLGKAMRRYDTVDEEFATALAGVERRYTAERRLQTELGGREASVRANLDASERELASARGQLDRAVAIVAAAEHRWGRAVPTRWNDRSRADREMSAPYADNEFNCARSELFLAAMRLHHSFLMANRGAARAALGLAADFVAGKVPRSVSAADARAAWQWLFFTVPVLSTTFASFARQFAHLDHESLGWLIVDEAGQATPQNAVGAIWRARRVVVLGDPQQLEPIVGLPLTCEQALRIHHDVAERWRPSRGSVQTLADQVTPVGTYLPVGEQPIWVGCPLVVHRRCDDPMFTISNRIAYDDLMIHGKSQEPFMLPDRSPATQSTWIDVHSEQSEGNWRPAEGEVLRRVIDELSNHGVQGKDVIVLTPFSHVARNLRASTRSIPSTPSGTVHVAQGREADIVILVLGSRTTSAGARSWAAEKPNLLNVAVSRAKRRLYVIGDRAAWADLPFFQTLAAALPVATPNTWKAAGNDAAAEGDGNPRDQRDWVNPVPGT